jgi:hypothetical protein
MASLQSAELYSMVLRHPAERDRRSFSTAGLLWGRDLLVAQNWPAAEQVGDTDLLVAGATRPMRDVPACQLPK